MPSGGATLSPKNHYVNYDTSLCGLSAINSSRAVFGSPLVAVSYVGIFFQFGRHRNPRDNLWCFNFCIAVMFVCVLSGLPSSHNVFKKVI